MSDEKSLRDAIETELGVPYHEHDQECFEDCPRAVITIKVEDIRDFVQLRERSARAEGARMVVDACIEWKDACICQIPCSCTLDAARAKLSEIEGKAL